MKKCLLIILLFFILIYSSLSAELKNNIEELYKKKQFDKIIFKYDKADNDFNSNEKYIIAKVLKQEGRKQNAKSLYFELLDRGYKNQSFLYKLWNLIDRDEKGFFFKNALKHYPKNNFVKYRYINYLESTRNYEKLIYFLEKNLQNSNYHNTNTINKLINLYLQKGLFKNRYSKYKSAGTVLSLYMSVIADDYKYFRKKFISLSRKKQNKLIKFVLKKGKLKILNKSYNNLKNRKYKLLLDYLVNEKTISVDNISSDKLKFILNSCMEYGKFKKAEKLLKNIETNNKISKEKTNV